MLTTCYETRVLTLTKSGKGGRRKSATSVTEEEAAPSQEHVDRVLAMLEHHNVFKELPDNYDNSMFEELQNTVKSYYNELVQEGKKVIRPVRKTNKKKGQTAEEEEEEEMMEPGGKVDARKLAQMLVDGVIEDGRQEMSQKVTKEQKLAKGQPTGKSTSHRAQQRAEIEKLKMMKPTGAIPKKVPAGLSVATTTATKKSGKPPEKSNKAVAADDEEFEDDDSSSYTSTSSDTSIPPEKFFTKQDLMTFKHIFTPKTRETLERIEFKGVPRNTTAKKVKEVALQKGKKEEGPNKGEAIPPKKEKTKKEAVRKDDEQEDLSEDTPSYMKQFLDRGPVRVARESSPGKRPLLKPELEDRIRSARLVEWAQSRLSDSQQETGPKRGGKTKVEKLEVPANKKTPLQIKKEGTKNTLDSESLSGTATSDDEESELESLIRPVRKKTVAATATKEAPVKTSTKSKLTLSDPSKLFTGPRTKAEGQLQGAVKKPAAAAVAAAATASPSKKLVQQQAMNKSGTISKGQGEGFASKTSTNPALMKAMKQTFVSTGNHPNQLPPMTPKPPASRRSTEAVQTRRLAGAGDTDPKKLNPSVRQYERLNRILSEANTKVEVPNLATIERLKKEANIWRQSDEETRKDLMAKVAKSVLKEKHLNMRQSSDDEEEDDPDYIMKTPGSVTKYFEERKAKEALEKLTNTTTLAGKQRSVGGKQPVKHWQLSRESERKTGFKYEY